MPFQSLKAFISWERDKLSYLFFPPRPALTWADGNLRIARHCPDSAPAHNQQGCWCQRLELNWTVLKTPSLPISPALLIGACKEATQFSWPEALSVYYSKNHTDRARNVSLISALNPIFVCFISLRSQDSASGKQRGIGPVALTVRASCCSRSSSSKDARCTFCPLAVFVLLQRY